MSASWPPFRPESSCSADPTVQASRRPHRGCFADRLKVEEFVNADTLAQGLSAFRPEDVALQAGRIMLKRLDDLESQGKSFAFESTLASQALARRLERLKKRAYRIHILYLWLPTAELAIARVAERVRAGGHDVLVRRCEKTILAWPAQLFQALPTARRYVAPLRRLLNPWSAADCIRYGGEANTGAGSRDLAPCVGEYLHE